MNIEEQIKKYQTEYNYHTRRAAEIAAEHQRAKETRKAMEIRLKELRAKQKEQQKQ